MDLLIRVMIPGWNRQRYNLGMNNPELLQRGNPQDYRNLEDGLRAIEYALSRRTRFDFFRSRNLKPDIVLFPGGFVTYTGNEDEAIRRLKEITKKHKSIVITGFDEAGYVESPIIVKGENHRTFYQASLTSNDPDFKREYAEMQRVFYMDDIMQSIDGTVNDTEHRSSPSPEIKELKDIWTLRDVKRSASLGRLTFGVVSCGELFEERLRGTAFRRKPHLLFGCVHYGEGFRWHHYAGHLDDNSVISGFFSYHTNTGITHPFSGVTRRHIDGGMIDYWIRDQDFPVDRREPYFPMRERQ